MKAVSAAVVWAALALAPAPARALPGFRDLYQDRVGYGTSCVLCHGPADNRLTPYAREYMRLGRGSAAMKALEVMDPDRDGTSTKDEISGRSNPGDPRSTPDHVGPWLAAGTDVPVPRKVLEGVFGPAVRIETVTKRLRAAQAAAVEQALGDKLADEDRFVTVFRVREASADAAAGRAVYAYHGVHRLDVFLVLLGPDPVIRAVHPVAVHSDQRFGKDYYLRHFAGKTADTLLAVPPPLGAEAAHAALLAAVRRAMALAETVAP